MSAQCDCGAATEGKWADKHSLGCAALKPDLIDRAALLKRLRKERDSYVHEHFVQDPETGAYEGGREKEEYLGYLDEQIEMIESLPSAQ